MLSTSIRHATRRAALLKSRNPRFTNVRTAATAAASTQKRAGDISDAFASLAGQEFAPLEPRYADLKTSLRAGHEDALTESWQRLLKNLQEEIPYIVEKGPNVIPQIDFKDIDNAPESFRAEHKKRGVAVIRNVIPDEEALAWKDGLRKYIRENPQTKAFPPENPQVFELYWSPAQLTARAHPALLKTQRFLMEFWHSKDPHAQISVSHPTAYADRVRMRLPGDARFALGPHVDGGSVERWEREGYGLGGVYDSVFQGKWESLDPWEASCRLPAVIDRYQGIGACSMFRMSQGWLSMSDTGPREGTLLVNPLLAKATAYYLLRPFFEPKKSVESAGTDFLNIANWRLEKESSSWVQGATPGRGQELSALLHPHLNLEQSMVHVPRVQPGDYVSWHCDTIHAVDSVHAGNSDSSVLYIPSCPLTVPNAEFMLRQRQAFLKGEPCPDFGGGVGEGQHIGRWSVSDLAAVSEAEGMRAFGLEAFNPEEEGLSPGQKEVINRANKILGFYD